MEISFYIFLESANFFDYSVLEVVPSANEMFWRLEVNFWTELSPKVYLNSSVTKRLSFQYIEYRFYFYIEYT